MRLFALRRLRTDDEELPPDPIEFGPIGNCRGERRYHTRRYVMLDGFKQQLAYKGECCAYEIVVIDRVIYRLPCARETGRRGWHYGRHRHGTGIRFSADGWFPE